MQASVVAIGDELLVGALTNTNSAYIAGELSQLGISIKSLPILTDEPEALLAHLQALIADNELLICTGGLGRTLGDHTRQVAAQLFQSPLQINELVRQDLRGRAVERRLSSLSDQAMLPKCALPLLNPIGFAPGLVIKHAKGLCVFLPGHPIEARMMFNNELKPHYLTQLNAHKSPTRKTFYFNNLAESELDPYLENWSTDAPGIDFISYRTQGSLALQLSSPASDAKLVEISKRLLQVFGARQIIKPARNLEESLLRYCCQHQLTLGVAESATGGALATRLTRVPGAGNYFKGGIVTSSPGVKEALLKVSSSTLERHGAVSAATAREMAFGAQARLKADFAIAITGHAGPTGGTDSEPLGTVFLALLSPNHFEPEIVRCQFKGDSDAIIEQAVHTALAKLHDLIQLHIRQEALSPA